MTLDGNTRLKDPKLIEELYADGVKFLDRAPRVEADAIAPIVEFMGKKPIAVETIADNLSSTAWCARDLSINFIPNVDSIWFPGKYRIDSAEHMLADQGAKR
jgi:hypothetical protein